VTSVKGCLVAIHGAGSLVRACAEWLQATVNCGPIKAAANIHAPDGARYHRSVMCNHQ